MSEATERAGFDLFAGSYWTVWPIWPNGRGDLGAALTCVEEALRSQRNRVRSAKGGWYGAHAAGLALEAGEVDRAESFLDDIDPEVGRKASMVVRLEAPHCPPSATIERA